MTTQNNTVDTKPNEVPIPAEWAALGACTGYAPRAAEDLRLCVIGPSNEGKTTWLSSIPNHLILDFEQGATAVPGGKAVRIRVENYNQFDTYINKLLEEGKAGQRKFKRITLDSGDELVDIVAAQLEEEKHCEDITEYGSKGSGFKLIRDRIFGKLRRLEDVGYTWSIVMHLSTKTETDPVTHKERTVMRESIYPSLAKKFINKCDFKLLMFCLPQTIEMKIKKNIPGRGVIEVPAGTKTVLKYFVNCRTMEDKEGKSRGVPTLEGRFEVPLVDGWKEFESRYNKAVEETKQKYGA